MRFNTVILAALLVSGSALGFDLKGVELGKFASHEQLHQELGIVCIGKCGKGRTIIAGVDCTTRVVFSDEKMVDGIVATFGFQDFEVVNAALRNKYGAPTRSVTKPIITGTGIHLIQVVNSWIDDAGNVLSVENYSDATHGRLVLATKTRIELIMQRANEI
jgi:hypothetical protein